MSEALQGMIDNAWEGRDQIGPSTGGTLRTAVETVIDRLDRGELRVADKGPGGWSVNQWIKKAVLLSFRLNAMTAIPGGPGGAPWWDKVPSKFDGWDAGRFTQAGFRVVPGAIVPARRVRRPQRCADAQLRQYRRLRR
jgi:2,3,4,5-tetrahydropyridine-2-carboxylate N-succinyltransferase